VVSVFDDPGTTPLPALSLPTLFRSICSASALPTLRPVSSRSIAWPIPTRRGRRTVPPSISGTPKRRQNTPKYASSSITRRSHHRSEEHTSELQSRENLVCRLLLEKK